MQLAEDKGMSININNHHQFFVRKPANFDARATHTASSFNNILQDILNSEARPQQNVAHMEQLNRQFVNILTKAILLQLDRSNNYRLAINESAKHIHPDKVLPEISELSANSVRKNNKTPELPAQQHSDKISSTPFSELIQKASKTYHIDAKLIKAVIQTESNFNAKAVSKAGAQGLMQLMPDTAKDLNVHNAFDPEQNIMAGSRYLKQLLHRYDGTLELALAAYNWGMGNLERHSDKLPEETRN